ncbi:MAG: hypothetical protein MI741_04125 [Rhodospirillales bacterium]|nr:hypothetical protein [Rhodospirillales bacterium]
MEASPSTSPLTQQQQQQFAAASKAGRKLSGAARMAAFNGYSMLVAAALCAPLVFMDLTNGVVACVLGVLGYIEVRGGKRLKRLDATAARTLAWNQVALLGAILMYCAWRIYAAYTTPGLVDQYPELAQMGMEIDQLQRMFTWMLYGTVAIAGAIYQGVCAWLYLRAGRRIQSYLTQTPRWIIQLQRAA